MSISSMDNGFNPSTDKVDTRVFVFEVLLEIKERNENGTFSSVPKDKNVFKLRSNTSKVVCISIRQIQDKDVPLSIEKNFGILIGSGKNNKILLETSSILAPVNRNNCYNLYGQWDLSNPALEPLNTETSKGKRVHMSVMVDLVVTDITGPIGFVIETQARVFPRNEKLCSFFSKKNLVQQFFVHLKKVTSADGDQFFYEVQSVKTSRGGILNLDLNLSCFDSKSATLKIDHAFEDVNLDNPVVSGTGEVSKDCSDDELSCWAKVMDLWQVNEERPKLLSKLVKQGIPEVLRAGVWPRLCNCEISEDLLDKYRLYITKKSRYEVEINKDISRTFTAHEFFKSSEGPGRDLLFTINKAYAMYDEELGYCQGFSFLVASLLLHMPEEQAFCVLVKLMYDYGLRNVYKDGFVNLDVKYFQLTRLIEDQLPDLYKHFRDCGVQTHMFATDWFLTLFTSKFPLPLVYHVWDVCLLEGLDVLFQVALALLKLCKKELLEKDFESILMYLQTQLPMRCRNKKICQNVMMDAFSISIKKLKKYETEFAKSRANSVFYRQIPTD